MSSRTKRVLLVIAALCWLAYVLFFSFCRVPEDKRIDRLHLDVIFHFSSYFVLAMLGGALIRWWAAGPGILLAGGTELVQPLFKRTANLTDFAINLGGLALGLALWQLVRRLRRRRRTRNEADAPQRRREHGARPGDSSASSASPR